ncbi:hypothetical protein [Thermodesulfobacterium commune]|uniref:Uncharacterized protein n=1 Tax=Thermodesulfobacterium commune DSM 2178 TaxID=289377 RepID=A0A075WTR2_9BACT|nr:hypothetical protein [Thermodesulfobacterium commune]AIH04654.1 hypothetical protein HL41_08295 [Thermodesulfobacterium commune DSM 2178]
MAAMRKKELTLGVIFTLVFIGILFVMFQPWFGRGQNFLAYADELFNSLAKGSAYFIPKTKTKVEKFKGKILDIEINLKKPTDTPQDLQTRIALNTKLYTLAGAQVEDKGNGKIKIVGDLGQILSSALEDADAMYWNKGDFIKEKYGYQDEKKMFRQWHNSLSAINKKLTLEKKAEMAQIVNEVVTKAIEPSYNFYGITPESVKSKPGLLTGLLVFYVLYTVWWGFAIMYLMEGLGLSTKKGKKKEV